MNYTKSSSETETASLTMPPHEGQATMTKTPSSSSVIGSPSVSSSIFDGDDGTACTQELSRSEEFSTTVAATAAPAGAAVTAASVAVSDAENTREVQLSPKTKERRRNLDCLAADAVDRWGASPRSSSSISSSSTSSIRRSSISVTLEEDTLPSVSYYDDVRDGTRGSVTPKKNDTPPKPPSHHVSPTRSRVRHSLGRMSSDLGRYSYGVARDNLPMKPKRRGSEGSIAASASLSVSMIHDEVSKLTLSEDNESTVGRGDNKRSYDRHHERAEDERYSRWEATNESRRARRLSDSIKSVSSESSSSSGLLSASEIEAYVMARLPPSLKDKLDAETWNEIFTAAADSFVRSQAQRVGSSGSPSRPRKHCQQILEQTDQQKMQSIYSFDTSTLTAEALQNVSNHYDTYDDDSSVQSSYSSFSETSEITSPTVFQSSIKKSKSKKMTKTSMTTPDNADGPRQICRSWYEESGQKLAPQLPTRECSIRQDPDLHSPERMRSQELATLKRRVSFDKVIVRSYERILDLHPATSSGPSVGIGWDYIQLSPKSVKSLEYSRRHRRSASELLLSRKDREDILLDLGYSGRDIARAVRHNLKKRNQRKQTIHNLSKQNLEEMVERSSRKVRKVLAFGFSKPNKAVSVSA